MDTDPARQRSRRSGADFTTSTLTAMHGPPRPGRTPHWLAAVIASYHVNRYTRENKAFSRRTARRPRVVHKRRVTGSSPVAVIRNILSGRSTLHLPLGGRECGMEPAIMRNSTAF